ncbi:MAG: sigma 54-interacting transcriptional regulator [Alphaproteobacteria bacterium]
MELAAGGTLVLDEVTALPPEIQTKIARALQERRFYRVGHGGGSVGSEALPLEARIIGTTCRFLNAPNELGGMRPELYDRLVNLHINLPPLRERVQDIPAFAALFMREEAGRAAVPLRGFSSEALKTLQNRAWPGNLRQLRNVIEWIGIAYPDLPAEAPYGVKHLPPDIPPSHREGEAGALQETRGGSLNADIFADMPLREAREAFERTYLLAQLERFGGNVSQTAKFVGMERSALHRKLKMLEESAPVLEEQEGDVPSLQHHG